MDELKCKQLKEQLGKEAEPHVIPIEQFFDGNDDSASIGCNLMEHPGMDVFRETLVGLQRRSDVDAVYVRISELDPGEEYWPFTDLVLVAGTISHQELRDALAPLEPGDIGPVARFGELKSLLQKHPSILEVWWD